MVGSEAWFDWIQGKKIRSCIRNGKYRQVFKRVLLQNRYRAAVGQNSEVKRMLFVVIIVVR